MTLSADCWTVKRLGRGPTGRWVAVPPVWSGEWNEVSFFDTQPEAFAYAFWECSDRRELYAVVVDDALMSRGTCEDMELLALDLRREGWDARIMVRVRNEWVAPWL